ncbi:MAG: ABC transporter substrate-binding protein [Clostridia bacterium]|nr:ABC transporter substrate-binding protein [Clostridia bacterium]
MNLKKLIAVLLTLALLFSAAGCGGGTVDEGSTFTVAISEEIDTLNPLSSWMVVSYELLLLIYDPLLRYDENLERVSSLAESWDVSDDQLSWTFHLKEGVTWHDGEPFTSADVKFSYELFTEQEAYMYATYNEGIVDITCPDDYTVVMTTDKPKANMLMNTSPIVPKHIWEALEDPYNYENAVPIGTGPFTFDSEGEGFIKLKRNPNYFAEIPGNIENIVFVIYENSDTAAQALLLGEIDATSSLSSSQIEQLTAEKDVELVLADIPGFSYVALNIWPESEVADANPLLKDKDVRYAIDKCVDREKIVSMIYGNAGEVGTTIVNPKDKYHYEPGTSELRTFDPVAAGEMLEAAGYKDTDGDGIREAADGTKLSFELISIADNTPEVKTAQMIASDCATAGIEIELTTMDSGALVDIIYTGAYDMYIWGWGADVDPSVITKIFITDEWWNLNETGYSDARYDELFYAQMNQMDEELRIEMVKEMQKIAYENAHYIVYVYDNSIQAIRSDKWEGYKKVPSDGGGLVLNMSAYNYMNMTAK